MGDGGRLHRGSVGSAIRGRQAAAGAVDGGILGRRSFDGGGRGYRSPPVVRRLAGGCHLPFKALAFVMVWFGAGRLIVEVEVGRLDAEGRAEKECWWQLWAGVGFWARGVALGFRAV